MLGGMEALDPAGRDPLPAPRDDRLQQLVAYWDGKRGGRPMPTRGDIDPAEIPALLPCLILVEVHVGPRRFYYRLTGTRVDEILGNSLTGLYLEDLVETSAKAYWLECYERAAATRRPQHGDTHDASLQQDYTHYEWVMLPLEAPAAPGGLMILVGLAFRTLSYPPALP